MWYYLASSYSRSYTASVHHSGIKMSTIARLPVVSPDHTFSDSELRSIACQAYCDLAGGNHLDRIARIVGKPLNVIREWHKEDNWQAKRANSRTQREESKLAELTETLSKAGLKDARGDAIEILELLRDAKTIARDCLHAITKNGAGCEALDKTLSAIERIEKLSRSAYGRL